MLNNYLEENPKDAKQIILKVILAAKARQAARKAREMVQRKTVMSSTGLPGKLSDCSEKILKNVRFSLLREIQQGEQQNRDVIVLFKLYCL